MSAPKQNPYPVLDAFGHCMGWRWFDETGQECETLYKTQREALKDLLRYMDWLDNGPTLWQKLWWPIRYWLWPKIVEFWNDTRGARQSQG